ncbi:hypothetical protein PIB30_076355, partial [Stylosanthes scabra]|nr:hypothetical protein [Stylosanthes scabra]
MQDVGGSSSSSNHVEFGQGISINEGVRMLAPPDVPHFEDNSDNGGDDDEFILETQPPIGEQVLGLPSIARPLGSVAEEAAHYSTIDSEATRSASVEDGPSSYPISSELELEIGLKFANREIAMLAMKNYNIRRSSEFKVVESDRARYVCKCRQFGGQCQWMIRVAKTKSSRFWE